MRRCHYIKRNHTSETPTRAIWIQCATMARTGKDGITTHELQYGVALCGCRNTKTGKWTSTAAMFETANEFWEIVHTFSHPKTRTWIICTNTNLTLTILDVFNKAFHYGWIMTQAVIACPPCIVKFKSDGKSITFMDVSNIWPQRFAGIWTGKSTPEMSSGPDDSVHLHGIKQLEREAERLMAQMTEWWAFLVTNDLGGFSPTIGSQSVRVWRHKYMTHQVLIDLHEDALALARRGLFGGRCECWHVGKYSGVFFQVDINSSYAACMRDMLVPVKLIGHTSHVTVDDLKHWHADKVVIAAVTIQTAEPCYPVRLDTGLTFPTGTFKTVLAGEELTLAWQSGHVVAIEEAAVYHGEYAFRSYMDALWKNRMEARDSGDVDNADKWKMLMASFFGKWAQRGGYWENVDTTSDMAIKSWLDVDIDTHTIHEYRQFGGIIQERSSEAESGESHPAIAACITAAARLKLWRLMQYAGLENVFYVDTDSLLVNAMGFGKLARFTGVDHLGGLRIVGEYADIQVFSAKNYALGAVRRRSGVREHALYRDPDNVDQVQIQSLGGAIARGAAVGGSSRIVQKRFSAVYGKGTIGEEGKVSPLEVKL